MPPRSRRRPRKSANTSPSHISSVQNDAYFSVDPDHPSESDQPTRIFHRNDHDPVPDPSTVGNLQLPNPTTPPRPSSMYDDVLYTQHHGNQSAPDMNQRRKKSRKSNGGITRASGVSRPNPIEASISAPSQQPLTPTRLNETPAKAYAGPTFHASPAASSLPMPKFFSRSVPNVDKASSLKSMMEQDAVNTTSESDSSPFLENSRPMQDHQARENSPLDIFFQADRHAKAQAQAKTQMGSPAVSNGLRSNSQNDIRHHSRQCTDSSIGGIFPLEMDGAAAETPDTKIDNEPTTPAPKAMTEADYRDEQRKAQTLELKKLLYSPEPLPSASSSPCSATPSKSQSSTSPRITPGGGSPGLVPDPTSRDQQRHAFLLALAHKQISGTGTNIGSAPQRPPSSKLRKEMSVPSSPGVQPPELPATPTQSSAQRTSTAAIDHTRQHQNGYASPYHPFSAASTPSVKPPGGFQKPPSRHSRDVKFIEEDLRRILKLDVLGGDDATSVRS